MKGIELYLGHFANIHEFDVSELKELVVDENHYILGGFSNRTGLKPGDKFRFPKGEKLKIKEVKTIIVVEQEI